MIEAQRRHLGRLHLRTQASQSVNSDASSVSQRGTGSPMIEDLTRAEYEAGSISSARSARAGASSPPRRRS